MNNSGTFEETLPCGGTLKVSKTSWEISYYFHGPDLRYKGTFVSVLGREIESYIKAFINNWNEYMKLKKSIPAGGKFEKTGEKGMVIRIGGSFCEGVCLISYHMPIRTVKDMERVVNGYKYAANRAKQIQVFLKSL